MAQTTLNIRMDNETKRQFDTFCTDVGLNASAAINLFAKAVIRERRIPFDIVASDDPFYRAENQSKMATVAAIQTAPMNAGAEKS